MFSSVILPPHFEVITDNKMTAVELSDYMAYVRSDVEIERFMPPHLCRVITGALVVRWETGEHRC